MERSRSAMVNVTHKRAYKGWLNGVKEAWETNISGGPDTSSNQLDAATVAKMKLVSRVTRFATVMCVFIALAKLAAYIITRSAVVRTSALDSIGDLVANCITMYTGYRMKKVDPVKFPVGQSKFEPIGVCVFATLMAAMMFSNALGNLEELVTPEEMSRDEAIGEWFAMQFSTQVGSMEDYQDKGEWEAAEVGYLNFRKAFVLQAGAVLPEIFSAIWAPDGKTDPTFEDAKDAVQEYIDMAAEVETDEEQERKLMFQNIFLGCCATYKFLLWMFCICYAIPKSGSNVLRALAGDKRNDFLCTSVVIALTTIGYYHPEVFTWLIDSDSVDDLVSFFLSLVIIYIWASLVLEQCQILSQISVEADILSEIQAKVDSVVKSEAFKADIKAYYSSVSYTVEIDLYVKDSSITQGDILNAIGQLKKELESNVNCERVLVHVQSSEAYQSSVTLVTLSTEQSGLTDRGEEKSQKSVAETETTEV